MSIEKFTAAPGEDVYGPAITGIFDNVNADELRPMLDRHQISETDLTHWFPLQKLMDFYQDMLSHHNVAENMVAIGIKTIEKIPFPPETDGIFKALRFIEASYALSHRNLRANEGAKVVFSGENQALIIFNAPYPDDIMYGYVWGISKRFLPKGSNFKVRYVQPDEVGVTEPGTLIQVQW